MTLRVSVIYGATASGKSARALDMAADGNSVIINADSMQVYQALPQLTAQPYDEEKSQIPHRLYGFLHPSESCSAERWRAAAMMEITEAFDQEKNPIIVGGTGLYIKALIEGLSPIPPVPPDIRQQAVSCQEELGNPAFHAFLSQYDSVMAERLNPYDSQRLIRAWEVLDATGKSLSYWQSLPREAPPEDWDFKLYFINPDRETLYARCDSRFDIMIEKGVLEEVAALDSLIQSGDVPPDAAMTKALGFQPLRDYLQGIFSLEKAIEQAKQDTRHYAKRQLTWFRNQM